MKVFERGRNDWIVILIILVLGFLCVLAAGQLALRFASRWQLTTNMDSHLDPNSDFLTRRPGGLIEPVDASILTQPSWINLFLTPGASFVTGTPFPLITRTASPAPTIVSEVTNTVIVAKSPTNTLVYFPPTRTATSRPASTDTSIPPEVPTLPTTLVDTPTATTTLSPTPTGTGTSTFTPTATTIPIPTDPTPPEIGITPDGNAFVLPAGGILTLGINLVANGDSSFDLVYYEFPAASGILMDWVILEISDGNNWYTIFNWGNNLADTNTNMDFNILSNPQVPEEPDQRDVPSAELYNSTGIAINIDAIVPPGTYSYIRFIAPAGDVDNQMEIDAIEVLP